IHRPLARCHHVSLSSSGWTCRAATRARAARLAIRPGHMLDAPRMQVRHVAAMALALVLLAGPHARAEGPTTTEPPSPPPAQTTKVTGEVPADLTGRWLALGQVALASGSRRSVPVLWEITRADGNLVLAVQFATLPPAMQKVVDDSNAGEKG